MSVRKIFSSVRHAIKGVVFVFKNEQNFKIQIFISFLIMIISFILEISKAEWIVILLMIFSVLILELLNTALEFFIDVIKPRLHQQVEVIKDIMAGMVLVASIASMIIGLIIFWPYIIELLY